MKTKKREALKYFAGFLLPLSWIFGFAAAMTERNEYVKANIFIFSSIRFVLIFLFARALGEMRLREIKGWYWFLCTLAALIMAALSMWLHLVF